jgi:hypothetical protein
VSLHIEQQLNRVRDIEFKHNAFPSVSVVMKQEI